MVIRLASETQHPFEIAFFRNLFGLLFTLPLLFKHGPGLLKTAKLPLYLLRCVIGTVGMLAGFCGTLMTPMAANFNVVPANLLELPDRNAALNGVIRAQLPTALIMLGVNMALMYFLAFRF